MSCDRCKNEDITAPVLGWNLCPVCQYDAQQVLRELVEAGRAVVTADGSYGFRWAQMMHLVKTHGFFTPRTLRMATGMTCYQVRDTISGYVKRGKIRRDAETGRYYIVESAQKKKVWGVRKHQFKSLAKRDGFVTIHSYAEYCGISYATSKSTLNDYKHDGVADAIKDGNSVRYVLAGEHVRNRAVESTSAHEEAGESMHGGCGAEDKDAAE